MDKITVKDGTQIYYKDWGAGQPLFFAHFPHIGSIYGQTLHAFEVA